jgi:trimeric autotransporter adhesin
MVDPADSVENLSTVSTPGGEDSEISEMQDLLAGDDGALSNAAVGAVAEPLQPPALLSDTADTTAGLVNSAGEQNNLEDPELELYQNVPSDVLLVMDELLDKLVRQSGAVLSFTEETGTGHAGYDAVPVLPQSLEDIVVEDKDSAAASCSATPDDSAVSEFLEEEQPVMESVRGDVTAMPTAGVFSADGTVQAEQQDSSVACGTGISSMSNSSRLCDASEHRNVLASSSIIAASSSVTVSDSSAGAAELLLVHAAVETSSNTEAPETSAASDSTKAAVTAEHDTAQQPLTAEPEIVLSRKDAVTDSSHVGADEEPVLAADDSAATSVTHSTVKAQQVGTVQQQQQQQQQQLQWKTQLQHTVATRSTNLVPPAGTTAMVDSAAVDAEHSGAASSSVQLAQPVLTSASRADVTVTSAGDESLVEGDVTAGAVGESSSSDGDADNALIDSTTELSLDDEPTLQQRIEQQQPAVQQGGAFSHSSSGKSSAPVMEEEPTDEPMFEPTDELYYVAAAELGDSHSSERHNASAAATAASTAAAAATTAADNATALQAQPHDDRAACKAPS